MFTFSEDIGMEFGLKKCGVVILKKGKLVTFDVIHLPNQEIMKQVDENGYTYLGILDLDGIKEHEMKIKSYSRVEKEVEVDTETQIE